MATIYDQAWPSSYVDQKHQADLLLDRAKVLYARKTAITVVRYSSPTQGDWENAYVTKTGLPLPIPVGTKLFWKSLKSGRILQYGSINDVSNGLASSGTVYNLLNMDYPQPACRFLGFYDGSKAESLHRAYNGSPQFFVPAMTWLPSGSFVFGIQMGQIYYWMTEGLESLMLVYRARTSNLIADPSPKLSAFFNRNFSGFVWGVNAGVDAMEGFDTQMVGSATTAALLGAPTGNVAGTQIPLLSKQTASDSAAGAYSYGQLWFHNVSQQLETLTSPVMTRENYHNPVLWGEGSYFGATITEANTAINVGMVAKEDNGYTIIDNFGVGFNYPSVGFHSSKLWVYGLFKNATGEISE